MIRLIPIAIAFSYLLFLSSGDQTCTSENQFIDDYHFPMVADEIRNFLYEAALRKIIKPNKSKVLDVGAGSMLLSMMAVDLGAKSVLGVEANPNMAKIGREVIQANNFSSEWESGKIRQFEGRFEDLNLGHKMIPKPIDIMVSETFDAGLIGENFLSILKHAKVSGMLKKNAVIIPNSAVIFGQLLESTFSLRRGHNDTVFPVSGKYNLEALRPHRPASVYTVRYLNEQNAVRQRLSAPQTLFDYDFQNYDTSNNNFAYSCVIFEVTEDGMFDSIGLWFNLHLDAERNFIVSNAPASPSEGKGSIAHSAPCWMQAMYRVSRDVYVRKGDIVRVQLVQLTNTYVIGDVGVGESNVNSRLIKFVTRGCSSPVELYAFRNDPFEEIYGPEGIAALASGNEENEYLFGSVPVCRKADGEECFKVFASQVFRLFKIVVTLPNGKSLGMWYQIPDSSRSPTDGRVSEKVRASRMIPLDTHVITCPS